MPIVLGQIETVLSEMQILNIAGRGGLGCGSIGGGGGAARKRLTQTLPNEVWPAMMGLWF